MGMGMRMSGPSSYSQSGAVPPPSDGDIRAVSGEDPDPDPDATLIQMFAGTGEFYALLRGMVRAIFGTPDIDAKHREMIILRAASILDVPSEWQADNVMASKAGLTDAEIEAATSDGPVSGIAPEYVLICSATDELLRAGTLTDDTQSAMLDTFGPLVTRKYSVTVPWLSMLSLFLNAARMPLETTDKIGSQTSPLDEGESAEHRRSLAEVTPVCGDSRRPAHGPLLRPGRTCRGRARCADPCSAR
jgi:hypothetical protein